MSITSKNVTKRKLKESPKKEDAPNVVLKEVPKPKFYPRLLSRAVVALSLTLIVYFTYEDKNTNKVAIFARKSDLITYKDKEVKCSPEHLSDVSKFPGCVPTTCRRFVTDTAISQKDTDDLLKIFHKFLAHGGSPYGATILDLHSGALSKGDKFINAFESIETRDLLKEEDVKKFQVVKEKIKFTIATTFGVEADKLYLTYPTFFSKLEHKEPQNIHDEYWHKHIDKETYPSFHFTSLLYLSSYMDDFEGGRFMFVDTKPIAVEPRKGRLSVFTSGSENSHYVERVANGTRYAITISFTCDDKYRSHL